MIATKLCNSGQLNTLASLCNVLGFEEKKVLIYSFINANLSFFLLVWHFRSSKYLNKIYKKSLRHLYNKYISDYNTLIKISEQYAMEVKRLRILTLEMFKAIPGKPLRIKTLGSHIRNRLPEKVKTETSHQSFRNFIEKWFGPSCKCNLL